MDKEEVIDIERFDNTVIEVASSPTEAPAEVFPKRSTVAILNLPKRIIIGVSILLSMIVPLGFGIYLSYKLQNHLKDPIDPKNIWPDTGLTTKKTVAEFVPLDYSLDSDNFYPIPDSKGNVIIEIPGAADDKNEPTKRYMALYLVENISGDENAFGVYAVQALKPEDLTKSLMRPVANYSMVYVRNYVEHHRFGLVYYSKSNNYDGLKLAVEAAINTGSLDTFKKLVSDKKYVIPAPNESRVECFTFPEHLNDGHLLGFVETIHQRRLEAKKKAEKEAAAAAIAKASIKATTKKPAFMGIPKLEM